MAKTDFLTADMTRRQFMKISGKSLAGLTLSASMLSLFGCSQKQVDSGAVATWALPQGLLVVNADLCTGCQRCEINCTLTNDGVCSSYISRVKIQRRLNLDGAGNGLLSGNDNCFVYFPDTCRQCEDPACGNACPQKAITTNEQGIRVVDTDKCIGCGACHEACPWLDFLYSKVPDLRFLIQLFLLQQYFLVLQLLRFYLQSKFLHLTESRISFQFLLSQAYPQFLF